MVISDSVWGRMGGGGTCVRACKAGDLIIKCWLGCREGAEVECSGGMAVVVVCFCECVSLCLEMWVAAWKCEVTDMW